MSDEQVWERIDELAEQYHRADRDRDEALAQLKDALHEAGQMRIDGRPLNRTHLVQRSGLSRRTVYTALERGD